MINNKFKIKSIMPSFPSLRAERDLGARMSFTFSLFRTYFNVIFKNILWLAAPLIVVSNIFALILVRNPISGWSSQYSVSNDFDMLINQLSNHPTYFMVLIFLQSIGMIMIIAIVNAFLYQYLKNPNNIKNKNIQKLALKSFISSFLIFIVFFGVIGIVGAIIYGIQSFLNIGNIIQLIIFWGFALIVISVYSIFAYIIVEIEKKTVIQAFIRSFQLIKGYWWDNFAYFVLFFIIIYFLAILFVIPFSVIISVSEFHKIDSSQDDTWIEIISALAASFSSLGIMFLMSLFWMVVGVQYFYMVEIKEMIGLKEAIDTIGTKTPKKDEEERY
ncbi:MAG: hypothetical protein OHK0038_23350 [Flammeovirgaceae bacterium]